MLENGNIEAVKQQHISNPIDNPSAQDRGYIVINTSQLISRSGTNVTGVSRSHRVDLYGNILFPFQRNAIVQMFSPIFSIVSNTAKMVSSIKFSFIEEKKIMDKIEFQFRKLFQMQRSFYEYFKQTNNIEYFSRAMNIRGELIFQLNKYGILPDLSNFEQTLIIWKREIQFRKADIQNEINDWFENPNEMDSQEDFIEKWIYDYMVHSASAIYIDLENRNPWILSGGTVKPFYEKTITQLKQKGFGYLQYLPELQRGYSYLSGEINFTQFMPVSHRATGYNPVENLIREIIEYANWDLLIQDLSNKEKPPEKLVLLMKSSRIGNIDDTDIAKIVDEISPEKGERLEDKLNTPIEGGLVVKRGENAIVVDISRSDYMQPGSARQEALSKRIALDFGLTSLDMNELLEINRATSESELNLMKSRAVMPILAKFKNAISHIVTNKFGIQLSMEIGEAGNEIDWDKIGKINASGVATVNEIRTRELNMMPLLDESADKLPGSASSGDNENKPLIVKNV